MLPVLHLNHKHILVRFFPKITRSVATTFREDGREDEVRDVDPADYQKAKALVKQMRDALGECAVQTQIGLIAAHDAEEDMRKRIKAVLLKAEAFNKASKRTSVELDVMLIAMQVVCPTLTPNPS
jgi:hypothetical protein